MVMEKLTFENKNQIIAYYEWNDVENPKGIIQIAHGMVEYAQRYDNIAKLFNQNGYIVPGVSCRMMAEKLYYLAAHPMERDQMALAAFKKASAFEPEKIVDKWMGEFINVLKNQ